MSAPPRTQAMETTVPRPHGVRQITIVEEAAKLRARLLVALNHGDLPDFEKIAVETEEWIRAVDSDLEGPYSPGQIKRLIVNGDKLEEEYLCLNLAISSEKEELALRLIDFGAKLPWHNSPPWLSLLSLAMRSSMSEIIGLLFADVDQAMKNYGLLLASKLGKVDLVRVYLEHGAEIDWQDNREQWPLFVAVENKDIATARILLNNGARIDLKRRDGRTIYELALRSYDDEMAHLILDRHQKDSGSLTTANIDLDLCLHRNEIPNALRLLESGHDVSLRATTNVLMPGEGPIVGGQNEYLKYLCSSIHKIDVSLGLGKLPAAQDTSSDEHFLYALRWVLDCLTKHDNCIRVEGPLPFLPTRVIDVGVSDNSVNIALLETKQMKGRYVALSHRWGKSNIAKTTRSNLQTRLEGMLLSDLTRTMQDAVNITRRLGIRYIWIDAICIIQDSHSDWSDEASRMSDIYRNSLLTISAAASADHSQGCFASSDTSGPGGDLTSRGWILQEELLSPRTLEYGFGVLKWECITCVSSSEQKENTQISQNTVPTEIARLKRAIWGFRSTSMTLEKQAYASWQHMVASYSRRTLTNESDKLMAIMGIAAVVEKTVVDTFLSGLWGQHLYQDLLWTSNSDTAARITSTPLPSWSWASIGGPITYARWPAGSSSIYLQSMLHVVSTKVEDGENGSLCQRLVFKGYLLKVSRGKSSARDLLYPVEPFRFFRGTRIQNDDPPSQPPNDNSNGQVKNLGWAKRAFEWERRILVEGPLRVARSLERGSSRLSLSSPPSKTDLLPETSNKLSSTVTHSTGAANFWPDIQSEKFSEAWLFPVASEDYWIHCLVLLAVGDVYEQSDAEIDVRGRTRRSFRRVGKCHVNTVNSTKFFSNQVFMEFSVV